MRRWEEIKLRQHRLAFEVEQQQTPAHIDHIMKSGFTMSDIKGLHRTYNEDGVEADEQMMRLSPSRPQRKNSMTRPQFDMSVDMNGMNGQNGMNRSTSQLDIDTYQLDPNQETDKKRGRSPFKFFSKKGRDQSKDKHKSKSPVDRNRGARGPCEYHSFLLR